MTLAKTPMHMTQIEAHQLALRLLKDNGLHGWKITYDRKRKTAGWCQHSTKTICFSTYLLGARSWMESWQTVTHEVAHAMSGPGAGHGVLWQRNHRALGGNAQRCYAFDDENAPWIAQCPEADCPVHRAFYRKTTRSWWCKRHHRPMVLKDQRKATIAAQRGK